MLTIAPVALVTTITFDYLLMRSFGAAGIAMAPAASGAVSLAVLFVLLRRTMQRLQHASASSF